MYLLLIKQTFSEIFFMLAVYYFSQKLYIKMFLKFHPTESVARILLSNFGDVSFNM